MANVFFVSPDLGPEDRLTAYWHYVLDAVPGVGQPFVDHVSSRAGLAPSKFLGSIDHPMGDRVNRPDFSLDARITMYCANTNWIHRSAAVSESAISRCVRREVNSSRSSPPGLCHSTHQSAIPRG